MQRSKQLRHGAAWRVTWLPYLATGNEEDLAGDMAALHCNGK